VSTGYSFILASNLFCELNARCNVYAAYNSIVETQVNCSDNLQMCAYRYCMYLQSHLTMPDLNIPDPLLSRTKSGISILLLQTQFAIPDFSWTLSDLGIRYSEVRLYVFTSTYDWPNSELHILYSVAGARAG
jgi:hypothetical protein